MSEPPMLAEVTAEDLISPLDRLEPPVGGLCSIGLECGQVRIVDEPKVTCALTIVGAHGIEYDSYAGVETRGRSAQSYPKPHYSLELRAADGSNQPTNLGGMGADE